MHDRFGGGDDLVDGLLGRFGRLIDRFGLFIPAASLAGGALYGCCCGRCGLFYRLLGLFNGLIHGLAILLRRFPGGRFGGGRSLFDRLLGRFGRLFDGVGNLLYGLGPAARVPRLAGGFADGLFGGGDGFLDRLLDLLHGLLNVPGRRLSAFLPGVPAACCALGGGDGFLDGLLGLLDSLGDRFRGLVHRFRPAVFFTPRFA